MKIDVKGAQQAKAAIEAQAKKMFGGNMYALVGYGQGAGNGGLIKRAFYNQFGTGRRHRPFLDKGVELVQDQWLATGEKGLAKLANNKGTMDETLTLMAQIAVAGVQTYITELKQPANLESTVRRKGSSNPLIDTGQMRQQVSFELTNEQPEEM